MKVVGMVAGERQHVVAYVREHDPVLLLPEPDNPYDPHAVAVYTMPRHLLEERGEVVSSLVDPDRIGHLAEQDRRAIIDRQAGYLPREIAATLRLPATGIVGYVSTVRYAPPEYVNTPTGPAPAEPRVAGFDVCAWLERTDPDLDNDLDAETVR